MSHQRENGHTARKGVFRDERAAQLVEFAVALPLLMVFVVGIFDFSSAYTLKQKLTNIARDAARVAAADPASDLENSVPASVVDAFEVIDNYLLANQINDCGVTLPTGPSPALLWTASASGKGCPTGGITITINRGYYFQASQNPDQPATSCTPQAAGTQTSIIATCVSIQYAYQWQFGKVSSLLGSTTALPSSLTALAVAMNEN
jgi:Flp pilus assembly protein TadG